MGKTGILFSAIGGFVVGGIAGAVAGAVTGRDQQDADTGMALLGATGALIGTVTALAIAVPADVKDASALPSSKTSGTGAPQINPQVSP